MTICNNAGLPVNVCVAAFPAPTVQKSYAGSPSIFGQPTQSQYGSPYPQPYQAPNPFAVPTTCGQPYPQPNPYGQPSPFVPTNVFGSPATYTNSIIPYDVPIPALNALAAATRYVDPGMMTAQGAQSFYYNPNVRGPQWEYMVNSGQAPRW